MAGRRECHDPAFTVRLDTFISRRDPQLPYGEPGELGEYGGSHPAARIDPPGWLVHDHDDSQSWRLGGQEAREAGDVGPVALASVATGGQDLPGGAGLARTR